jgi:glycosyltransferase involved in cell wall biosynthesis
MMFVNGIIGIMRTKVIDLELSEKVEPEWDPDEYDALRVLARYHRKPIAWITLEGSSSRSSADNAQFQEALIQQLGNSLALAVLNEHIDGGKSSNSSRDPISIVVCTRDRTAHLAACLRALQAQEYPFYEIIVVDNAPSNNETALLARGLGVRYVHEPRPGLNWARNRAVKEARYPIIAFTDDDARPDRFWLAAINTAFGDPGVRGVTGFIAPAELETKAQHLFELAYGGMGKGFDRQTFRIQALSTRELLWANSFGVGANMAFRRDVFSSIGDFDVALDAGTPAGGAGDLDMFHRLLANGFTLVYEPSAVVWHIHRRSEDLLAQQVHDNGRSFGAYLLTCIRNGTVTRSEVLSFIARELLRRWVSGIIRPRGLPRYLILQEFFGALGSPFAYRASQINAITIAKKFHALNPQTEATLGSEEVSTYLSDACQTAAVTPGSNVRSH